MFVNRAPFVLSWYIRFVFKLLILSPNRHFARRHLPRAKVRAPELKFAVRVLTANHIEFINLHSKSDLGSPTTQTIVLVGPIGMALGGVFLERMRPPLMLLLSCPRIILSHSILSKLKRFEVELRRHTLCSRHLRDRVSDYLICFLPLNHVLRLNDRVLPSWPAHRHVRLLLLHLSHLYLMLHLHLLHLTLMFLLLFLQLNLHLQIFIRIYRLVGLTGCTSHLSILILFMIN